MLYVVLLNVGFYLRGSNVFSMYAYPHVTYRSTARGEVARAGIHFCLARLRPGGGATSDVVGSTHACEQDTDHVGCVPTAALR